MYAQPSGCGSAASARHPAKRFIYFCQARGHANEYARNVRGWFSGTHARIRVQGWNCIVNERACGKLTLNNSIGWAGPSAGRVIPTAGFTYFERAYKRWCKKNRLYIYPTYLRRSPRDRGCALGRTAPWTWAWTCRCGGRSAGAASVAECRRSWPCWTLATAVDAWWLRGWRGNRSGSPGVG